MQTIQIYDARQNAVVNVEKIDKLDSEWKTLLTEKEYEITTKKGTEIPGSPAFYGGYEPRSF